jgi:polysaccharide biosynthesis/export protein
VKRLICFAFAALAACGPAVLNYDYAKEPDPRTHELVLGVGDVVGINVWENPQLNTEATIRPDGTITMPLVGDLHAAGTTPTALKEEIKKQLANYVKQSEIAVAVKAWKSYRFTVEGEVTKPGVFSSDQYVQVAEAMAMASGLTRFAKRGEIKLLRRDPKTGDVRQIPLDYDELASGRRLDMNIWVLPGDRIYVP